MPKLTSAFLLAGGYLAVVLLAAGWAFYIDSTLLHSQREHLLPDIVLDVVSLPSSLSIFPLYNAWPEYFSKPFSQVGWATFCGLGQAALLFIHAGVVRRDTH